MFRIDSLMPEENLMQEDLSVRQQDAQFILSEIKHFLSSEKYRMMIDGCNYYLGKQDILHKQRLAIGEDPDNPVVIKNLPNNRIVDNQYQKMVDQKANYLAGQPFVISSENDAFVDALKPYIQTKKFFRLLKAVAKDSLNCGVGWMMPYYNAQGELAVRRFRPYEIIPEWADEEHTELDAAIRVYEVMSYERQKLKTVTKVEIFNRDGIQYFTLDDDRLIPEDPFYQPYFVVSSLKQEIAYNWTKIPLIPFRYNAEEIPLITRCKGIQDGLNRVESMWEDQMEEDPRNTILVLVNYDGEDLGEFRRNLATYGAVKVRSDEGAHGDVRTLQVAVNAENYKSIISQFKKAIIENCMGYDAKDDRIGSNANEMNIESMYSDIELDANGMDTEYQAAFEELIWFLTCHLSNIRAGDFSAESQSFNIIFNRDIMINESTAISDCRASVGLISDETIIANHPWVDDPAAELERVRKQREAESNLYGDFGKEEK